MTLEDLFNKEKKKASKLVIQGFKEKLKLAKKDALELAKSHHLEKYKRDAQVKFPQKNTDDSQDYFFIRKFTPIFYEQYQIYSDFKNALHKVKDEFYKIFSKPEFKDFFVKYKSFYNQSDAEISLKMAKFLGFYEGITAIENNDVDEVRKKSKKVENDTKEEIYEKYKEMFTSPAAREQFEVIGSQYFAQGIWKGVSEKKYLQEISALIKTAIEKKYIKNNYSTERAGIRFSKHYQIKISRSTLKVSIGNAYVDAYNEFENAFPIFKP